MPTNYIYFNNAIIPESQVCISPFDYGFLYGDGIFDTIKAENGVCEYLDDHLDRFRSSAEKMQLPVPDIDYEGAITELLEKNGLSCGIARVKIIITRGVQPGLTMTTENPVTFLITAVAQSHIAIPQTIGIYPVGRTDPVSAHKSLSYIYNLQAKQWAKDNGFDDALLVDTHGRILECTSSNIFIERNREILKPKNRGYYLEGIMGKHFCMDKADDGYTIEEADIRPEDITEEDTVIMTNSMIGYRKVNLTKQ